MLDLKLTTQQQQSILNDLFAFNLIDESDDATKPHFVIYDEEGFEIFGKSANLIYDFSTLRGILKYVQDLSFEKGKLDCQNTIKKALGL